MRAEESSPRKRGCFSICERKNRRGIVFPAQAGVFPVRGKRRRAFQSLPRASGGVSDALHVSIETRWSSPRKRGCFQNAFLNAAARLVFPAQAGVFPVSEPLLCVRKSLPRASGGVSRYASGRTAEVLSSPRKRGCFRASDARRRGHQVFPAQAGVFLETVKIRWDWLGLPRASGGVSSNGSIPADAGWSSPRKRGCFPLGKECADINLVFPAQAGVFPARRRNRLQSEGLPRASGGVSLNARFIEGTTTSSPRKRGCFCIAESKTFSAGVFPAQAGVFPPSPPVVTALPGLPRASGGISR